MDFFNSGFSSALTAIDNFEQIGITKLGTAGAAMHTAFIAGWNFVPAGLAPLTDYASGGIGKKGIKGIPDQLQGQIAGPVGEASQKKHLSFFEKMAQLMTDPKAFAKYAKSQQAQLDLQNLLNQSLATGNNALNTLANTAGSKAAAIVAGQQKAAEKIKTIVGNLQTLMDNFLQANETMMGGLFQGPVMNGPIGQVYQQLAQYNIAPPIKLLIQDQQQQNQQFEANRKDLRKLKRKGAPQAMIDELMSSGPAGRLAIQSLSQGTQKQIDQYIKDWKSRRKNIQDATSIDYKNKLNEWKTYGKSAMLQMLLGMRSQSKWLAHGFTKYILTDALGAEMTKWFKTEFPNFIKNAGIVAGNKYQAQADARAAAKAKVKAQGYRYRYRYRRYRRWRWWN